MILLIFINNFLALVLIFKNFFNIEISNKNIITDAKTPTNNGPNAGLIFTTRFADLKSILGNFLSESSKTFDPKACISLIHLS